MKKNIHLCVCMKRNEKWYLTGEMASMIAEQLEVLFGDKEADCDACLPRAE